MNKRILSDSISITTGIFVAIITAFDFILAKYAIRNDSLIYYKFGSYLIIGEIFFGFVSIVTFLINFILMVFNLRKFNLIFFVNLLVIILFILIFILFNVIYIGNIHNCLVYC